MSVAGSEQIIGKGGVTPTQMGVVYSAFLLTYTLMMTPMGVLADRFGPWRVLTVTMIGLGVGSVVTGSVGLTVGVAQLVTTLVLVRGVMGSLSSSLHPSVARTVGNWIPVERRGLANGLTLASAMVGVALTYYFFGSLMDATGWPTAFFFLGGATLLAGIAWIALGGDFPTARRGVPAPSEGISAWRELLGQRNLLLLTLAYTAVCYFEYLFFYWMQYYFGTVLDLGAATSRLYSTIVTLSMALGVLSGGGISDRLSRRLPPHQARRTVSVLAGTLGALFLVIGVVAKDAHWIVLWFSCGAFSVTAAEAPCWTAAIELGGTKGSTAGAIMNTAGNVAGFIAPILTPWIGTSFGWGWSVGLGALISLAGALVWLGVTPDPPSAARRVSRA